MWISVKLAGERLSPADFTSSIDDASGQQLAKPKRQKLLAL